MKTVNYKHLIIALTVILVFNIKSTAQVGIGTTNPEATSMLDIQSTSKGVLIPRMLTSERTAITTPANGLLVFDTDTKSFWFYNVNVWKELVSGSSIVDADGDTKVEVEKTTDEDKIHFTTLGTEKMSIDNAGNTRIGDGTNNTYIEADGSLSYEGSATRWDDLKVPVTSTKKEGTKPPSFDMLKNNGSGSQGVITYFFDQNQEQELYFTLQLPHAWKEGSAILPHVHWSVRSDAGSNNVVWGLEYTWVNVGGTFGNTTIITGGTPIAAIGAVTAYEHAITSLGSIDATGKTLSSMMVCRIFRDATNPLDDYPSDAYLFEIDFHYEIDSDGSRLEFVK